MRPRAAVVGALLFCLSLVVGTALFQSPTESVLAAPLAQGTFSISGPAAPNFPENSTAAVATYSVSNAPAGSTVSWSIDGTDAKRFTIDSSGVLKFKAAKNFEKPNDGNKANNYEVDITATAGSQSASIEVIVTVTDVNEAPEFELTSANFSVAENSRANKRVGGALAVTDPDDGDTKTFSVSGKAKDKFSIDTDGQIRVKSGATLDYETASTLTINAVVTDSGGLTASLPVTITLTDADDPGVITFRPSRPYVGVAFVASVSDDDGVSGRVRWRWHRAENADDDFDRISGATKSTYTPTEDDEDYLLRVTVTYEDNFESQATAAGTSASVSVNTAPAFAAATASRSVTEEAAKGTKVGSAVTATDADGGVLTYSLTGTDSSYFTVGAATGQISVDVTKLPAASTKSSYSVTLTVTDEAGATDTIAVTITAASSNTAPTITGSSSVSYAENGTGTVSTYTATDSEGDSITWSLSGTDAARFSISSAGALTFKSAPDYEKPNDGDKKNDYEVTIRRRMAA